MNVDKKRKIFTEQKPLNKSILHKCLMNFGIENMWPTTSKLKRNKTYLANTMYYTSFYSCEKITEQLNYTFEVICKFLDNEHKRSRFHNKLHQ